MLQDIDRKEDNNEMFDTALKIDSKQPQILQDNLATVLHNLKFYCSLLIDGELTPQRLLSIKQMLLEQLDEIQEPKMIESWSEHIPNHHIKAEYLTDYKLFQNIDQFQSTIRELQELRNSEQELEELELEGKLGQGKGKSLGIQEIIDSLFLEIKAIVKDSERTVERLEVYDPNENNMEVNECGVSQEIVIEAGHYFRELINHDVDYPPETFAEIEPPLHRVYLAETLRAYHDIVPIKIKHLQVGVQDPPVINYRNYFHEDTDQAKQIIGYCVPNSKVFGYYFLSDACKLLSITKEYYQQKQLDIKWQFSPHNKSVCTRSGKVFAIGCRTTNKKIDPCMYQITQNKASNRGPLPSPKRDSSILYLNSSLYVIGGCSDNEKGSKKNYRYSIKDKKWKEIAESNVALRKPTICVVNNRFIMKMGGLNEFDYINKMIEMYDTTTDRWSIMRTSPKNILEEIEILEDSLAVQVTDDQVYIFGGKNANRFSSDSGFILQINEIIEKRKKPAKVSGEFWNVSLGKRNILSFFGNYSQANVILHHNAIYLMRVGTTSNILS